MTTIILLLLNDHTTYYSGWIMLNDFIVLYSLAVMHERVLDVH